MPTKEISAEDFINQLSDKGKSIVNEYLSNFKKKKSFKVFYSDHSYVKYSNPEQYLIFVNANDADNIEYNFMHEFFHCVQHEDDFPSVYAKHEEYQQFANELSSYILDFNVNHMLSEYLYVNQEENIYNLYNKLYKYFSSINSNMIRKQDIIFEISVAMALTALSFSTLSNSKLKKILSLVKNGNGKIYHIYKSFYQIIKTNDFNAKEGINKIFCELINIIHFENHLTIY
ncbi:MAG: hypothetical protein NC430_10700 [bacterium]|nr:hypothetical protein [bacterium]MCM1423664.1 hypothetical protein [bacterium]